MKKERVLYLDIVRIIGFLAVTAYHFAVRCGVSNIKSKYLDSYMGFASFRWAPIAYSCFFMVSGAALIYRYGGELHLKEYYKKRFLGIFPLFWLAYLIVFLEEFYRYGGMPEAPKIAFLLTVIGMDGYMKDYMPTFELVGEWFLGVIIILYILFPLYRAIMRKNKYILSLVLMGIGLWLSIDNPFPMMPEKNPLMCSMYFVIGMLFEMIRENPNRKAVAAGRRIAATVGVGAYVGIYLLERVNHFINNYVRVFILSISFYLIAMELSTWVKSERAQRLIVVIGSHSFSYYLLHHAFLRRYVEHFGGRRMSGTNTLIMFISSVLYIYLLAVGLDKLYARLVKAWRGWQAERGT